MLHYAVVFLVIALIAAIFGFGGIAAGAVGIAKILFFVFIIMAVLTFVFGPYFAEIARGHFMAEGMEADQAAAAAQAYWAWGLTGSSILIAILAPLLGAVADGTEVLLALSCESRDEVDALVAKAVAAGATTPNAPKDYGFMYQHGFADLDGHLWEVFWMDEAAAAEQM